jgi:hypothetical protein
MHYNRDCGLAVTIHNGYGFGPDSIIEQAPKQCCQKSFDRVFILMDEDLDITLQKSHRTVRSLGVVIWRSGPQCIEGFFFKLLGKNPPATSKECKREFHKLALSETEKLEWESYKKFFPRVALEKLRHFHPHLDNLIKLFSNKL